MGNLKRAVHKHGVTDILILARTSRDLRATIYPTLESFYAPDDPEKPTWSPATSEITWPKLGAKAVCISAESGSDSSRGLNTQMIFADECAFYAGNEEIIDMSFLTLRRAPSKFIGTTSPFPTPKIIEWVNRAKEGDPNVKLVQGSTYDNAENLSEAFMDGIVTKYAGTSLARQELLGELVLENTAALFQNATIDRNLIQPNELPQMKEIAIGLDPSLLGKASSVGGKKGRTPDACGIVVCGAGDDERFYAIDNFTQNYSVEGWVNKSIEVFDMYARGNTKVTLVIESNLLGQELLQSLYEKQGRRDVWQHVKTTFSTQNKLQRMQPYSLMAEQDKIGFVQKPSMNGLYTEMCSYSGDGRSPNAYDALAFALSVLSPMKKSFVKSYELNI